MKLKLLIQLFVSFFKIGLMAFGGGYTVIPLIQSEIVERRKWITDEELTDVMAISQSLPGAIMSNASTIIGYRVRRFWGALLATVASILPTFIIVLVVAVLFWGYTDIPVIKKAFTGVLLGITSMIICSLMKLWKTAIRNYFDVLSAVLASTLLILFKVNAILVIIIIAAAGFIRNLIIFRSENGKNEIP